MINILIPLAGTSRIFENQFFPKPLFEINNTLMIEYPITSLKTIEQEIRFIFILRDEDCLKFHLDKTLKLLTNDNTIIIKQKADTKGAICSCLLAIDHIDNEDTLIISNGDQYIDVDYNSVLQSFAQHNTDGGVICFDSVHPQWSYAKLDDDNNIIETAEKNPISRNAIAGFYYFKKGQDFIRAAKKSIEKNAHVDGIFYIAPTYNELILEGKTLKAFPIKTEQYFSFYSFSKIREFEKHNVPLKAT